MQPVEQLFDLSGGVLGDDEGGDGVEHAVLGGHVRQTSLSVGEPGQ